ncbi:MAG: TolB family protein [Prolixibacteraceae bacterium]
MKKIPIIFLCLFLLGSISGKAQVNSFKLGSFDALSDIGAPGIPGSVSYSEPAQIYSITASGSNIWFGEDSFSMLWKKMNGDFILQTQIKFIGEGHEMHRKTGIMFRKTNSKSSPMVAVTVHAGDGLTSLQFRKNEGDDVEEIKMDINGPTVLQLEKKGNTYIMSAASYGSIYQYAQVDGLELGETLMAGIYVCSHNNEYAEEVNFSNTRIFKPAPETLVQYEEYLGSLLEVVDIETGMRQVLTHDKGSWQAPNWTPDGKDLMYNSNGKLYNFNLESYSSTEVNTDFATKNNNDHVLSFDGSQLGISHHSADDKGQSVIYALPASGGVPQRVTDKSPSYLHGWSPDNKSLLYTAERNGDYDIYSISVKGGKEQQLTTVKGLDDGSEYSRDGKFIYFCSTRTGTMQVWRMDADGGNQTQLTFDEMNDWFPHVSPDNKWLIFISFPKEVPADKHPFYQHVYLRMIPVEGGEPKVITYLYGGQGSMNVPSWSPDSKKVAFVSNGLF